MGACGLEASTTNGYEKWDILEEVCEGNCKAERGVSL